MDARSRRGDEAQDRARLRRAARPRRRARRRGASHLRGRRGASARQGLRRIHPRAEKRRAVSRRVSPPRRSLGVARAERLRGVRHGPRRARPARHGGRVRDAHVLLHRRERERVRRSSRRFPLGRLRHAPRPPRRRAQGDVRGGAQAPGVVPGRRPPAPTPAPAWRRRGRRFRLRHVPLQGRRVLVRARRARVDAEEDRRRVGRRRRVRRPRRVPRREPTPTRARQGLPRVAPGAEKRRAEPRRRPR